MSPVYLLLSVALVAVMCPQPGVFGDDLKVTISADKKSVKINTNVKFTCTASGGTGSYKPYTWMGCTDVSGENKETCVLTANRKGSMTVSCKVTEDKTTPDMATSDNYQVHFYEEEIQAEISADKTGDVKINTNVTLTCEASGGVPPYKTYSWTRESMNVPGQTAETYELTAKKKGPVKVTCKVTDDAGDTKTSDNLIVTFKENPIQAKISADPTGDVKINTNVTLTCGASGGNEVYTKYAWTKNGQAVTAEERETYQLTAKTKGNVRVKCTVADRDGNEVTSDKLTVLFSEDPIQAKISADKPGAVKINTNVKLTCTASGGTEVYTKYSWTGCKNTTGGKSETCVLTAERKGDVTVSCTATDSTMPIPQMATSGSYKGPFYEEEIRAEISADKTCDVKINTIVTFTCKASGGTEVYTLFTWKNGGETVTEHTGKTYELTAKQEGKETVSCSVTDKGNNTATSEVYTVTVSGAIKPTVSLAWSFSLGLILWAVFTSSKVELSL